MNEPTPTSNLRDEDDGTGLPALPTWRAVYIAVFAIFCCWVVLLTALSRAFD